MKNVLCLALVLWGCRDKLSVSMDPRGKLLYVEAKERGDGLSSGSFGEIYLLDPHSTVSFRLTYDDLYDAFPVWDSGGQRIVFSSRRTGPSRFHDLSDPSRLFEIRLQSMSLHQIDLIYDDRIEPIPRDTYGRKNVWPYVRNNFYPAFNHKGTEVAFFTYPGQVKLLDQLVVHNLESDTITLMGHCKMPIKVCWSDDDSLIAFSEIPSTHIMPERSLTIVDRYQSNLPLRIHKKGWYLSLGDFWGGKLVYSGYEVKQSRPGCSLFSFDITTHENTVLHTFERIQIHEIAFKDSASAFIIASENDECDIYFLSVLSGSVTRITDNGKAKEGLSYLR